MGGIQRRGRPRNQWKSKVQNNLISVGVVKWEDKTANRKVWTRMTKQALDLLGS